MNLFIDMPVDIPDRLRGCLVRSCMLYEREPQVDTALSQYTSLPHFRGVVNLLEVLV
jgi:hypothetical protein